MACLWCAPSACRLWTCRMLSGSFLVHIVFVHRWCTLNSFFHFYLVFERVWISVGTVSRGQRTTSESHFSPSITWLPRIELRPSGWVAGNFTCCTISLALNTSLLKLFLTTFPLAHRAGYYERLLKVLGEDVNQLLPSHCVCLSSQLLQGALCSSPPFFCVVCEHLGTRPSKYIEKGSSFPSAWQLWKEIQCMETTCGGFMLELCGIQALSWFLLLLVIWSKQILCVLRAHRKGCCYH